MKVTYEFNCDAECEDYYELRIFQNAHKMHKCLHEIKDYLVGHRKEYSNDDAEVMEGIISEIICESDIGEIE